MTIHCQRQYQLEDFEFVGIDFTKFYHVMPEVRTLFYKFLHASDKCARISKRKGVAY